MRLKDETKQFLAGRFGEQIFCSYKTQRDMFPSQKDGCCFVTVEKREKEIKFGGKRR